MEAIERLLKNVAKITMFKQPTGEYKNSPVYRKGEGWGLAAWPDQKGSLDLFVHIVNVNFIELDKSGPDLGIRYGRFESFGKAARTVLPPKENEPIIILEESSSFKDGKLQSEATNWMPLAEVKRVIDKIKSAPKFRVRMVVYSTTGQPKDKVLTEGNNEEFVRACFQAESLKKNAEFSIGGKTIRTEIVLEKLQGETWVKA